VDSFSAKSSAGSGPPVISIRGAGGTLPPGREPDSVGKRERRRYSPDLAGGSPVTGVASRRRAGEEFCTRGLYKFRTPLWVGAARLLQRRGVYDAKKRDTYQCVALLAG